MDTTRRNFRVVDLVSQADAVARYTQGWQKRDVLTWLGRYGKIRISSFDPDVYFFLAPSGLQTGFVLRESGEFLLIIGHTTNWLR